MYGSPGAGKAFTGSRAVLYALLQGLNIMLTVLMTLRTQSIGGLHLHKLFKISTSDGAVVAQCAAANTVMEK